MAFINGRYYMNPAYGRAIERARLEAAGLDREREEFSASRSDQDQNQNGHWVTINGRHVFIQDAHGKGPEYDDPQNENEARLANVVYNETASLRANPKAKSGAPGSPEDLHNARVAVARVAHNVLQSKHPERVQAPSELSSRAVDAINGGNKDAILAHNDSLAAARAALAGSGLGGATQYRINSHDAQKNDKRQARCGALWPVPERTGRHTSGDRGTLNKKGCE